MASLSRPELARVTGFLRGTEEIPHSELLTKLELGLWVFPPFPLGPLNIFGPDYPRQISNHLAPLFLAGRFGAEQSAYLLHMFREQHIPYLLIRVQSWEAHIKCNGEILTEHCEENLDAMREACEKLRRRCKQQHPSVANP